MIFKRGQFYTFEFSFGGRRYRRSTKSTSAAFARRAERALRDKLEEGHNDVKPIAKAKTVRQAVSDFIESHDAWSPRTLGIAQNSWRHLGPFFGSMLLQDITVASLARYRTHRRKEGAGKRTVNIEVGLIRSVLIEDARWEPLKKAFKMLAEPEDVGRALTPDEEVRLLAAARKSVSRSLYPAILLSIHTGMRNGELRLMRWRQVDLLKEEVVVGKSKTVNGEGRVIPLSQTALKCLQDWRALFPDAKPSDAVFPSERYGLHGKEGTFGGTVQVYDFDASTPIAGWKTSWTTCRKAAGVQCRWHDLRHTFVSRMGESLVSDTTLMAMTGHLSRKMLERYSHTRMEAKRAAVRVLDSRPDGEGYPQNRPQVEGNDLGGVM